MNVASAFEILQVASTASREEIYASYRRLLMEYHPDRNIDRSEWSHRMTVRLTDAFDSVSSYLASQPEVDALEPDEVFAEDPDSGYSMSMQARIASLYDMLIEQIRIYYETGMDNIHLRQEGTMRLRYRSEVRRCYQLLQDMQEGLQWPGSALQHSQLRRISDFTAAFYENMLIKPGDHEVPIGDEAKANRLYRQGARALDQAIQRGVLTLENSWGLICPGARKQAEQSLMLLLSNFSRSRYCAEGLIKLYLLRAFSALCEILEESL